MNTQLTSGKAVRTRLWLGRNWRLTGHFLACVVAWGGTSLNLAAAPDKPNIVMVVADDLGYSDLGCFGGEIRTPNLDRLADNGLRFTQFYNTTRCWPSRACLLTGYYAQQVRRDELPGIASGSSGRRPAWARLLPELLRPLGYRSYHSGKWHVDGPVLAGGFDASYSLNDHDRNFNPKLHTLNDKPLPAVPPGNGYYTTTAIAQRALDMLGDHQAQHAGKPFFLYLAFTCPHFPLHALPEDIAVYRDRYGDGWDALRRQRLERLQNMGLLRCALSPLEAAKVPSWNLAEAKLREQIGLGEADRAIPWDSLDAGQKQFQATKMSIHAAMVHRMDLEIGRVISQLKTMGAFENTLFLFVADNGASAEQIIRGDLHDPAAPPGSAKSFLCLGPGWSSAANTPFRLHKSWVHEGGISTPLILHWPHKVTSPGALRHTPGHLIDLAPTVLAAAGGNWPEPRAGQQVPPPPGKNLLPLLAGDGGLTRDYLWWGHIGHRAIRVGDWKLVATDQEPWELYDLAVDRSECRNVAADHPQKVNDLARSWTNHLAEFIKAARP